MAGTRNNGRYNAGAQAAHIEALTSAVSRLEELVERTNGKIDLYVTEQREFIEALRKSADETHAKMNADTTAVRERVIALEGDTHTSNRLQAGLTLLASVLAAWLGMSVKR